VDRRWPLRLARGALPAHAAWAAGRAQGRERAGGAADRRL